ncbi:MAG: response regulator transcription factor [Ferruginibacter sp.]
METKFKIILVDDHVLLRDALATLISSFENFEILAVAANGREMTGFIEKGKVPDIVVLDLNMPVLDGYESAQWLHDKFPDIKILILTMYDSEIALIRLLQMGVRGFLKKDIHPFELKAALESVGADGYYYSHNTTGKLANFFQKSHENKSSLEKGILTKHDIEFLKMASTDLTYKEIADKMNITPRAIDGYRDNLFEKLDVKSRVGLAIYAVKNGIVTF